MSRVFKFRHTEREWKGIPVVAANMDTTGTFEIASELQKDKLLTCLQKFYSVKEIEKAISVEISKKPSPVVCFDFGWRTVVPS